MRTFSSFSASTTMAVLTVLLGMSVVMENLVLDEDDPSVAAVGSDTSSQSTDWMHE